MKLSLGTYVRDYSVAGGAVAYDADAQAYFTANTAITSAADKTAINNFYLGLKSDGIYTKIKVMYLPLWSSATNNKWNLINPLDTDAAYRLTFTTGWTHASTGMTPNGTSAYANTFFAGSNLTANSNHICIYVRTNQVANAVPFGSYKSTGGGNTGLFQVNISTGTGFFYYTGDISTETTTTLSDAKGLFIASTRANNDRKAFRNGSQIVSKTTTVNTTYTTLNNYLGARNFDGAGNSYSTQQICFNCEGDGLTDTQITNLSTRINTLMTYFGINTY